MPSISARRLPGTGASLVCSPVQEADKQYLSFQVFSGKLCITLSLPVPRSIPVCRTTVALSCRRC